MSIQTTDSHPDDMLETDGYLILVIGTCEMDIIYECNYFPQEQNKIEAFSARWQRGGRASNICTVIRKFQVPVEYLGCISSAENYQLLNDDMAACGIRINNCPQVNLFPNFTVMVLAKRYGTKTSTISKDKFPKFSHQHFLGAVDYRQYKWMHFEPVNPDDIVRMLLDVHAFNRRSGMHIMTSVELKSNNKHHYAMAELGEVVFATKQYLWEMCWQTLRESCYSIRDLLRPRRELRGRLPNIVCMNGVKGSACLDSNGKFSEFKFPKMGAVAEILGANEAFVAAVIYCLAEKKTKLHEAVEFAVKIECLKMGVKGFEPLAVPLFKRKTIEPRKCPPIPTEFENPFLAKKKTNEPPKSCAPLPTESENSVVVKKATKT